MIKLWYFSGVGGRQIYVSHAGNDTASCGQNRVHSCRTISHAISLSQQSDTVEVDHSGGPYIVEPTSGDFLNITHSLWIRSIGKDQHVSLNCSEGKSSMFNVFTPGYEPEKTSTIVAFTLERISIQGCVGEADSPGVISIANANINIKNSHFGTNAVVMHHPQIGGALCSMVKVTITNSTFTACGLSKPYQSCVIVMGCNTTNIHVQDTQFAYSGVQLQGDQNLIVNIVQSTFNGQNLRGPSLDIIMAPNQSQISLTDSTITSHNNSMNSAVKISVEQPMKFPSVHFTNVTFSSNTLAHSLGGAVSLVGRFGTAPKVINAEFTKCSFTGNSAKDVSGALYIVGLSTVKLNHCVFEGNTAVDGGAIFILGSQHITLYNSTFKHNQAFGIKHLKYKGTGGAMNILRSDVAITSCNFTNNTATFHGQAIHAIDMLEAYIENCIFTNVSSVDSSPKTQLHLTQVQANMGPRAGVAVLLNGNKYDSVNSSGYCGMFHVEVKGVMKSDDNTVCCPAGHHVEYVTQPQHTQVGYDASSSLDAVWCAACPMGTYNLQRDCLQLHHGGRYHKHQPAACLPCPDHAKCTGAGRVTPLKNYWGSRAPVHDDLVLFQLCPAGYCDRSYCNDIHCCSNQRAGPLCGQCQDGHNFNLATDVCIPAANCRYFLSFSILYAVAFGAVYLLVIIFFVVMTQCCLTPGGVPACQIQQSAPGMMDISGSTPWDYNSIQSSLRDGDSARDQRNDNVHWSEAVNPIQVNSERDDGSDSFEPSIPSDYGQSLDSHGLVPVQDDATQTSDRVNQAIMMKTQSNLLLGHPFLLCVVWMLVQLMEELYQPWYDGQDRRYVVINGILDVINFRPVYYMLGAPCISGQVASLGQIPLSLICITSVFVLLIVASALGNIILKVISKVRRSDVTHRKAQFNSVMSQMFVTVLTLVYLPILRGCFQLIHCVSISTSSHLVLFINGGVTCHQWWHWLVTVIIITILAPVGLAVWLGMPLLKVRHITSLQFMTGLVFPLPASLYWVCRHAKTACRCLFPYEFHFDLMQSDLHEVSQEHFQPSDSLRSFFTNPFQILCQPPKQSGLPQAEGRLAWIILIFLRGFVIITFSTMLSHWPVLKALILTILLLLAITLHVQWQPYGRRSANRIEAYMLSFLIVLAILGMNNALIYSMGIEPYGYLMTMILVNDWAYVILVTFILVFYMAVIVYYIIKSCLK